MRAFLPSAPLPRISIIASLPIVACLPSRFDDLPAREEDQDPSTECDAGGACPPAEDASIPPDAGPVPAPDASMPVHDAGVDASKPADAGRPDQPDAGPASCQMSGACKPGDLSECAPKDSCGQRTCKADCTWDVCRPRLKTPNACLRVRVPPEKPEGQGEGSNFRCCPGAQEWNFCQPNCEWGTECAPCESRFCEC
ncbi:MAG: hypothetical protein ABW252_17855 [Polyangiales bacterium]